MGAGGGLPDLQYYMGRGGMGVPSDTPESEMYYIMNSPSVTVLKFVRSALQRLRWCQTEDVLRTGNYELYKM